MSKKRYGREVSLGPGIDDLVNRLGGTDYVAHAGVASVWDEVVGPETASRTVVCGLRGGELLVDVDSPVWANELSAMSEQIVQALAKAVSQSPVRTIRFNVSATVARRNAEEAERRAAAQGYAVTRDPIEPLPEHEVEMLARQAESIEDPDLREAVLKTAVADIARKRAEKE